MNIVFILGTAGSGKSELTATFTRWLELQGENVLAVNLDPGAMILPYSAYVDVRDYIRVEDVMEEFSLGPNGGLMLACELMLDIINQLSRDVDDFGPDIAIIDTPGQMELFAFREIGARIADGISEESKGIIYLFDSTFCRDPLNYVMNMFIASAINSRFILPQISVLSKTDLLEEEELSEVAEWSQNFLVLENAINLRLKGLNRLMSQDMLEVISRLGIDFSPIPLSSKSFLGFNMLYAEISKIFVSGEPFTQ